MERISYALAVDSAEAVEALRHAAQNSGFEMVVDVAASVEPAWLLDQMSRSRPDIVFIEESRLWAPLPRVVETLRSLPGTPAVVVIHRNPDPETILEAMRAGVTEFIYPPFDHNTARSFERLMQARESSKRSVVGKTLGFLAVKGGCGASTLACQVAAEIQRTTESTLLADFDPDLGLVHFLLKTRSQYSIADALQNAQRLDRSMWQAFVANGPGGLNVLSTPEEPGSVSADPHQFSRFFRFVRSEYDVTVVDLGRGVTRFNLAAMAHVDSTCLVTTMEVPALHRARCVIRTLLNGGCTRERMRLVVNYLPKRQDISIGELEAMLEFPVYATVAEDSQAIAAAYTQNGLVSQATSLGRSIAALTSRLTGQPAKEPRKFRLFARA